MIKSTQPDDAASALAEIGRRQGQVIEAVLIPGWYWWIVAAGMVGLGAAVDYRHAVVLAVTVPVFVIVIVALTARLTFGTYRRVRVRDADLLGTRGALLVVGTVWLSVGLTLACALGLRALGSPAPTTIATAAGGALLIVTGPWLMRRLRQLMLSRRAGT
jgi:hypothetical protein